MIEITNTARKHFIKLLSKQSKDTQIRVFVINPGTVNAECGVSYCNKSSVKSNDIKLKFNGMFVYIDEISAPYLKDAKIDLIKDNLGFQLTIKAPNARIQKINKSDTFFNQIGDFLKLYINPRLKEHGGQVSLVRITNDMNAILKFSGGCNGCSMVNYTLKENIEKELKYKFPKLNGVIDETEHNHGNHSYL